MPVRGELVAISDHFRDLEMRIDMKERKRHMTEKSLAREPEQDGAVLADRPKHDKAFEFFVGFAQARGFGRVAEDGAKAALEALYLEAQASAGKRSA